MAEGSWPDDKAIPWIAASKSSDQKEYELSKELIQGHNLE